MTTQELEPSPKPRCEQFAVLHVAPIYRELMSGLLFSVDPLVESLNSGGVKSALLTTAKKSDFGDKTSYPCFWFYNFPKGKVLKGLPEPFSKPDLIVFHSTYIPAHYVLSLEARKMRIPYVVMPHGGMANQAQTVKKWKKMLGNLVFFDRFIEHAAALHCLTRGEKAGITRWRKPSFEVGNGVFLPSLDVLSAKSCSDRLRFLFLGRLDPHHKGLDRLIGACALIRPQLEKAKASFCLYGNDVQGSRAILEDHIDECGLSALMQVCNPVKGEAKEKAFLDADVFLHTSRFEGHPIAVLEALSYGLPCILSPGTNMAEDVETAGAGWSTGVARDDQEAIEQIAKTILEVIASREALTSMGAKARLICENQYAWESITSRLIWHYQRVVSQ